MFSNIKAGDEIGVNVWGRQYRIQTVDRVTNTLIVIGERRFRKSDGKQLGGDGCILSIATVRQIIREQNDENRKHELINILKGKAWNTAKLEDLEALVALTENILSRSQVLSMM